MGALVKALAQVLFFFVYAVSPLKAKPRYTRPGYLGCARTGSLADLALTTCRYPNALRRLPGPRTKIFERTNDRHALDHFSKDDVLFIEPFCFCGRNEKLRSIRVLTGVRHG